MINSILDSTKKALGLAPDYDAFDPDIVMHINTVFTTLNQLGFGPVNGYMIESDEETWDAFLGGDPLLNAIKTYMYLRVRKLFDPPTTSILLDAINQQIAELEWRLSVHREGEVWVPQTAVLLSAENS